MDINFSISIPDIPNILQVIATNVIVGISDSIKKKDRCPGNIFISSLLISLNNLFKFSFIIFMISPTKYIIPNMIRKKSQK